ncbi:MAG TPA: response regulator [Thermoanaerobaculia bacterium]|nr:response regulator [Thermoanaerobaculia bacterium]
MKRRILLADDSVTIQKVIELTFMDEDYEVRAVSNGDEAVRLLPEMKPDFVIADVHMPGANGYEVCRRSKELRPDVPVLLLVGTFEPFDEAQARAAGADSHLKKPFDSQELLQRVAALISARPAAAPAAAAGPTPTGVADWAAQAPPPPAAAPAAPAVPDWMSQPAQPSFGADTEPGLGTASIPEFAAEPSWGSFELEPEPAPSPFAVPPAPAAPEPFDREPSFVLEPEPGYQPAAAEPVFSLEESEQSYAIREDVFGAPSELSLDEAPQDRYILEEPGPVANEFNWTPEPEPAPRAEEPVHFAEEPAAAAAPAWEVPEPEPVYPPAPGQPPYEPAPAHASHPGNGNGRLSDDDVDRIARRVVELLGDRTVRDVAWEVIPDMAEVIIRDRLRELESQVE